MNSRNITIAYGTLSEITVSPTRVMQLKPVCLGWLKMGTLNLVSLKI